MHDADIPMAKVPYIMKWNYMSTTPAVMVSMLARISANILLTRLFSNKRWLKWFLWTFTAFQALCSILLIAFVWGQCKPVEGLWNPLLPARRWDPRIQLYTSYVTQSKQASGALVEKDAPSTAPPGPVLLTETNAAAFTISDLTYVLFPVIIIWDLHMPLRRRVGLALLMCLSLITAVASIMKTVLTPNAEAATKPDAQYNASFAVLWSGVEQTLVIILGCIAPLRAKFIAVMRDHFGWLGTGLVGMVTSSKLSSPTRSARAGRSGYSQSTTGEFDKKQTYNFTMETQKQSRGSSNSSSQGSGHELTVSMREPVRPPATLGNGQIARTDDFIVTYSNV